jgi:transcription-repair coupling factor (superfamily II helicase)
VVTTIQALLQPVPSRAELAQSRRRFKVGEEISPEELAHWLVDHGFEPAETVVIPGQFGRRGGILDVFAPDAESPVRIEFFGDEIESIRPFSPHTQRRLGELTEIEITGSPLRGTKDGAKPVRNPQSAIRNSSRPTGHLCEYLPAGSWTVLVEPDELDEQGKHYRERVADAVGLFSVEGAFAQLLQFPSVRLSTLPSSTVEATCHLRVESVERFSGNVAKLREELAGAASGDRVLIACHNEAELRRLATVLSGQSETDRRHGDKEKPHEANGVSPAAPSPGDGAAAKHLVTLSFASETGPETSVTLTTGHVKAGFRLVEFGIVVLSDNELFRREEARQVLPRRRLESRAIDSFLDLAEGDLVVHVGHGIARYRGMQVLEKNGQAEEHLILEFREGTRVYVPASKIDLVQKYVGGSNADPELSRLGGTSWQRKKERVSQAVLDLASEMLDLQALREAQPGIAYPPDSDWQAEFEAAFPYQETPDQLTTLGEIKQDMQRTRPMDRLICGDVGYGKTELAVRAAFKAVDNGKQVAVLVPTTVLAEQHFRTFRERFAEYPFNIDGISRFRSATEQREILERLKAGGVDVIIGTHRLVSADVQFKDLGLVIIDEEQRFGVEHKERLKRLRQTVDVLTLTATPIPRTLHLSLLGIRDISNLETPPPDRLAIETRIVRFDPTLIRHAIVRELNREGQVYFVHNRVFNIKDIAQKLQSIVPEAKISVAHGQMGEGELEQAMLSFVRHESDILVATTIIESGLDIPNVNTIFINQADNYGLADLHQLRGRVGRFKHRAYAYMLLDSERGVTPTASRRLKAIEEFTELGAGFKIAMRDLEIRGAGNILGTQQSGHIAAVGYEMYCQLLENAVRGLKNMPARTPLEVNLELPFRAYLPRDYVTGQKLRVEVYRRLGRLRKLDRLEDFRGELVDRFGALPEPAEWLLRLAEIRLLAAKWHVATIHIEPPDVVLGYNSARIMRRLAARAGTRFRIVDDKSAFYRLKGSETDAAVLYGELKELLRYP